MGNELYLRVMSESLEAVFSFNVTYFGALHFENHDELDATP